MRRLGILVLLVMVLAVPVEAFTPKEQLRPSDVEALAWMVEDSLYVAVANTSNVRERYSIESATFGRGSIAPFDIYNVLVPAYTVMLERIPLNTRWNPRWDGELSEVLITSRSGARSRLEVGKYPALAVSNFVVAANTPIEVEVDLEALVGGRSFSRIMVDRDYQVTGTNRRGNINFSHFWGGFSHSPGRNEVVYQKPIMNLRMRTPYLSGVSWMTFDFTLVLRDYARQERIKGPVFLVYGNDMRFINNSNLSTSGAVMK